MTQVINKHFVYYFCTTGFRIKIRNAFLDKKGPALLHHRALPTRLKKQLDYCLTAILRINKWI